MNVELEQLVIGAQPQDLRLSWFQSQCDCVVCAVIRQVLLWSAELRQTWTSRQL